MKFNPFTQQLDFDTVTPIDIDGTMAANSDLVVPSQKAVVTYVASELVSLASLKGAIDASGNPNYPAAVAGDFYYVTVAGKVGGASGAVVSVGDALIAKSITAAGDQAAVGANWIILEANIPGITSVGNALATLPNPSAITFVRINADNTVTARTASELRGDLGFTTVGSAFATLANPSAITFPRINADNSVAARSASNFRTDLGATTTGSNLFTLTDKTTGIPQDYFYWLDAADATNGATTWTSKEGKVFTSTTITKTASGINSQPTVQANNHLYTAPTGVTQQAGSTIFVVGTVTGGIGGQRIVSQNAGGQQDFTTDGGTIPFYYWGSISGTPQLGTLAINIGAKSTIPFQINTPALWVHRRNNTDVTNAQYNASTQTTGPTETTNSVTAAFNRFYVGDGGDMPWTGQVAEVIFFNRHLNNAEYNAVGSFLATKYGFTFTPLTEPDNTDFIRRNGDNTITARAAADFRTDIGGTTVGSSVFTLTNPSAVTFLRLNADNTSSARSASDFRSDIGGTTVGANLFTLTNPSAVTFLRLNADNTVSARSASEFRGDVGGTTVGANLFTLTNPSAITFLRLNADNTVTARSASEFKGDLVLPAEIGVALSDETTDITTGTAKITFRMPYAMTLVSVKASLATASSSGDPTVDINVAGSTILSTKLTIDATEKTSVTAATPAVISSSALASDDEITMDIDVAGTGAKGLKVWLIGTRA